MADLTDGAVAVVGGDFDQNSDAAWAVAFKRDLFVADAGKLAGAPLDGALDVIRRHVLGLRGGHGGTQTGILLRVASGFRGNSDFLDEAGEDLAAFGVESALLLVYFRPFTIAGHDDTSLNILFLRPRLKPPDGRPRERPARGKTTDYNSA